MSETRHEWKVGLFVFFGLALLVALLILFSKGLSFTPTYTLKLTAGSAGNLKQRAAVAMAGVPIGSIAEIKLAPDGRNVTILLQVKATYQIHGDARFVIEQYGFLGDQYVTVIPTTNAAPMLKDGDPVTAEMPFDLQEVARSAQGFIKDITDTAKRLNQMIDEIHEKALNAQTLTNLANSIAALNTISEQALGTVENLNILISTNTPAISSSVRNLESATASLTNLMAQVQAGRGTVGQLVADDAIANNLKELSANLNTASSNLNRYGIWKMLWHPPQPAATSPPAPAGKRKS